MLTGCLESKLRRGSCTASFGVAVYLPMMCARIYQLATRRTVPVDELDA